MDFQRLNLIGIGHLLPDPQWRINAHSHAFYEMIIVMAGRLHVEIAGKRVPADSGAVLLYPARMAHQEWSDSKNPFETYFISFSGVVPSKSEFCLRHDDRHRIRQMAAWLFADRVPGEKRKQRQNLLILQLILQEFFSPQITNNAHNDLISITRAIILGQIAAPLSLAQLAKQTGSSKYHFVRKFKRLAGRTPMAETRALRADYARDLLLTTDLPLKEIAAKTGLGDEYALSRVFRHCFGMPPGAFRKSHEH